MSWTGAGFVDHHARLLQTSVGRGLHVDDITAWHHLVLDRWSTPLDEPVEPLPLHDGTRGAIERGLHRAREVGVVELTEAGMDDWNYLEALLQLRARLGELPVRVRILVASGIADPKRKNISLEPDGRTLRVPASCKGDAARLSAGPGHRRPGPASQSGLSLVSRSHWRRFLHWP